MDIRLVRIHSIIYELYQLRFLIEKQLWQYFFYVGKHIFKPKIDRGNLLCDSSGAGGSIKI